MNPSYFTPVAGRVLAPPPAFSPVGHHHHHCGCEERPHYHEYCPQCCRPIHACCCGPRRCRKEAKELLVEGKTVGKPDTGKLAAADLSMAEHVLGTVRLMHGAALAGEKTTTEGGAAEAAAGRVQPAALAAASIKTAGIGSAFIGGGCCVHLSVEYMADNTLAPTTGVVAVLVADSDKTVMMWAKIVDADDGYQIQEDIISTHPGAKLTVLVINVTARVRWCEVFSC